MYNCEEGYYSKISFLKNECARIYKHTPSLLESPIALLLFATVVVKLACSFRWVGRDNWVVVVKGRSNSF